MFARCAGDAEDVGTSDVLARTLGMKLSELWGQPIVIENRTGGGGTIGTGLVAKATQEHLVHRRVVLQVIQVHVALQHLLHRGAGLLQFGLELIDQGGCGGRIAGLAEILEEVAGVTPADATPEKSFTDDLDVDSLSMVEVVVEAEEKFGVTIPDDEVKNLKTVGDAVSYIERNRAA